MLSSEQPTSAQPQAPTSLAVVLVLRKKFEMAQFSAPVSWLGSGASYALVLVRPQLRHGAAAEPARRVKTGASQAAAATAAVKAAAAVMLLLARAPEDAPASIPPGHTNTCTVHRGESEGAAVPARHGRPPGAPSSESSQKNRGQALERSPIQ
jgi:hypothetical protein